jgi:hypothetical protein
MPDIHRTEADLSAANTFTPWMSLRGAQKSDFTVLIAGTFVGTLTFQVRDVVNQTVVDLDQFTGPDVKEGTLTGGQDIRIGFKTGDFTSGTAECVIQQSGHTG